MKSTENDFHLVFAKSVGQLIGAVLVLIVQYATWCLHQQCLVLRRVAAVPLGWPNYTNFGRAFQPKANLSKSFQWIYIYIYIMEIYGIMPLKSMDHACFNERHPLIDDMMMLLKHSNKSFQLRPKWMSSIFSALCFWGKPFDYLHYHAYRLTTLW